MSKQFSVTLHVSQIHEYLVEANSPEEAESIAEQFFHDGEEGNVTGGSVEAWDVLPYGEVN